MKSFEQSEGGFSWGRAILPRWEAVKADFQERYGIDLDYENRKRSWHWLLNRVMQLLTIPPVYVVVGKELLIVQQTRFGHMLNPPGGKE